jgi:hypothetical protein
MAKNSLPSVEDYKGPTVAKPRDLPTPPPPVEQEGYIPRNVDVKMTRAQARILRDKLRALQDAGAKTADGKFVDNRAQAVRWIIENLVESPTV